jgi:hypothetical protein
LTWGFEEEKDFSWGSNASKRYKGGYYPMLTNSWRDNFLNPFEPEKAEKDYMKEHKDRKKNYEFRIYLKMFAKIKSIPLEAKQNIVRYRKNYEDMMKAQGLRNEKK